MQLGKKMQALCLHGEFDSASEPAGTLSLAAVLSQVPHSFITEAQSGLVLGNSEGDLYAVQDL